MTTLRGLITALVTPFDVTGQVDVDALRASVRFQIDGGVQGLCPLGGTGEPLSLTVAEHQLVMDTVLEEAAGRVPVVVGTVLARQADIIACARHAKAAGADAIMVTPPYFYGMTPDHVIAHFVSIADQADVPMVLFHSPARTGIRLTADTILNIFQSTDLFIGIKESSNDMALMAELIERAPSSISVLQGYEESYLATLALGGHGAILSLGCLVPHVLRMLYEACQADDKRTARQLQLALLPLCRAVYSEPNPGPLKAALQIAGRSAGATRPPIYSPSSQTLDRLTALVPGILDIENAGS